jgi:hypothetical protein
LSQIFNNPHVIGLLCVIHSKKEASEVFAILFEPSPVCR